MAKKKATDVAEPPSQSAAQETPGNGRAPDESNGEKNQPVFKVGPIASDKDHSVSAAVWQNEITLSDGRSFTVHNVTFEATYRDGDGSWKSTKSYRGSQLHVLRYCIDRCNDWILAQRDPAACPF